MGSRIAIIDRTKCIRDRCGYQCQAVCPGVRMGEETITIDDKGYPVISEHLCTGCGICVKRCPADAIRIINLVSEKDKPFHQYGPNMFRIYGIPLPSDKGIVGLIGKNGIGKTTALNILSGQLIPNFGEYDREWTWDDVLERLSVIEQGYFREMIEKKKRGREFLAYKIQYVDKLIDVYGEKRVSDLISDKDLIDQFELTHLLDRKVSELSGGELQRLIIAGVFAKDAELYFFDEPTSYLDIRQRIRIAKMIKELGDPEKGGKKVMVIEHDLAILDYLSDYVYIFYGQENAFGQVSHIRSARNGINEYLSGYLKDENVRFRDHEIHFERYSREAETSENEILITYPELVKEVTGFRLTVDSGSVNRGEVIGIIGPNAIGKTTFIKMLAGVIKPDNTNLSETVRIAYKPQYIRVEEDMLVSEVLKDRYDDWIFNECVRRLNLRGLMDRRLSELSGGELQRVAIATTLNKDADIYLFDEPSAFLDVEERLHFIDLLRQIISNGERSALVVDHDIVVVDGVSDRMIVFSGESGKLGSASSPMSKREGMNRFLRDMGITMRRDKDTYRPRINKPGSTLDKQQKERGEYYYV